MPNSLANVKRIEPKQQTEGYCQFSGGGDIVVHSQVETLIVQGTREDDDSEEEHRKLSPISDGTCASTTFSIEGKKLSF